jgi:hypothetical protein
MRWMFDALCGLSVVFLFSAIVRADVTLASPHDLRIVAKSGDSAPGGGTFGTLMGSGSSDGGDGPLYPQIDDAGGVFFSDQSDYNSVQMKNNGVYFETSPGTLVELPNAVGTPPTSIGEGFTVLSDTGTVAAKLTGSPPAWIGTSTGGNWTQTVATGGPGENFAQASTFHAAISGGGALAFAAADPLYPFRDAYYVVPNPAAPNTYLRFGHGGDPAPNTTGSGYLSGDVGYFANIDEGNVNVNKCDNIAFTSSLNSTGLDKNYMGDGLFKTVGPTHQLVAVAYGSSDVASAMSAPGVTYLSGLSQISTSATFNQIGFTPGFPASSPLNVFMTQDFNDHGNVVFTATLNDDATNHIGPGNDSGIWTDAHGSLSLVAQAGAPVPFGGGATFYGFQAPLINGNGRITFAGTTSVGDGLFTSSPSTGAVSIIALAGRASPVSGTVYGSIAEGVSGPSLAINSVGQSAVFGATLNSVGGSHDAIMSVDPYGKVAPVVVAGMSSINGHLVDHLAFGCLTASGGQDGNGSALNSSGYFTYTAYLDNNTTAVVTSRVVLVGDVNGDGVVNSTDTSLIVSHWSQTGTPGAISEDLNYDGVVDVKDWMIAEANLGHTDTGTGAPNAIDFPVPPPASVPEPGSVVLALFGTAGLVAMKIRRRRR